ncbi:uncharacterized protein F5147DRAFT_772931 [Suillus discolor]|uniref:Uncharacterized protein n=1 Tax=Suillus discolor TaxID=1912936 RepID=A0A9P7F873_9AGAM|nr:uncharacterized protein F5147DRAFT_772931 [Suillus discolor]KAG2109637.1 hypothetical protein F5147DRAFT_772931 [Suillus discolor]
MALDAPPTPPADIMPSIIPFFSLASQLSTSSIAHFLSAHHSPLTAARLAPLCITSDDFYAAQWRFGRESAASSCRDKVGPSVSAVQRRKYEALRAKFSGLPVRTGKDVDYK